MIPKPCKWIKRMLSKWLQESMRSTEKELSSIILSTVGHFKLWQTIVNGALKARVAYDPKRPATQQETDCVQCGLKAVENESKRGCKSEQIEHKKDDARKTVIVRILLPRIKKQKMYFLA